VTTFRQDTCAVNKYATLVDALNALPVGAEAIADHLAASGIKGHCRDGGQCAIAEYLTSMVEVPARHRVSVSEHSAKLAVSASPILAGIERVWFEDSGILTEANLRRSDIGEFIRNFDRGQYPDLVAEHGTTCEPATVAA
jgi:hypothetical protein